MSTALDLKAEHDALIAKISHLINQITGVQLGEKQAAMIENRVAKRIAEIGLASTEEYMKYIQSNWDKRFHSLFLV